MVRIRQRFPAGPPLDVPEETRRALARILPRLKPGMKIALGVGSRGIANLQTIVAATIAILRAAKCEPFIVPAMGSHGGATPKGQTELLAEYGISEANLGVPIHAQMEARQIGTTDQGVPVWFSEAALAADGIIVINRIKPHTDFLSDTIGSGVIKMLVVGLGKRLGAAQFHIASSHHGYEQVLRSTIQVTLAQAPLLCGLAIVENLRHETAQLEALLPDELITGEARLFAEAKRLLPGLPFDEIDLLIVDRIGKNISGTGMDTNVIGRGVHGYSTALNDRNAPPRIGRIFVRDLTAETHGNAIGIGLADFTTTRLVKAADWPVTWINALTSMTPGSAKVPIHFETDREAIAAALQSLALDDLSKAKIVRITDTLSLETMEVSEACLQQLAGKANIEQRCEPVKMEFTGGMMQAVLSSGTA